MPEFDTLAATVRRELPDFDIRNVELPEVHGAPVTFGGNTGEVFGPYLSEVYVDPYRGSILGKHLSRDEFSFSYIRVLVDAFHFGDFAGLVSKAIWFLFGLATTGLALSGVIIFWKRTRRVAGPDARPVWRRIWQVIRPWGGAMGVWKPLNLLALVVAIAASVMTLRFYSASADDRAASYAVQDVGPWQLGALMVAGLGDTSDPVRAGAWAMVLVRFCPDCWDDIKRVWINVGPRSLDAKGQRVTGQPGFARAGIKLPAQLGPDTRLWIVAEGWDGKLHRASWPVDAKSDPRTAGGGTKTLP